MNTKLSISCMLIAAMLMCGVAPTAAPARETTLQTPAKNDAEKKRLEARSEARYPDLQRYKSAGKLGETSRGLVEAVKESDAALSKLIEEENADRKALYALLSAEQGVSAEVVAKRAGQRNFKNAKKGEYLKDGAAWKQK